MLWHKLAWRCDIRSWCVQRIITLIKIRPVSDIIHYSTRCPPFIHPTPHSCSRLPCIVAFVMLTFLHLKHHFTHNIVGQLKKKSRIIFFTHSSFLSKPSAYITHNSSRSPTVQSEIRCGIGRSGISIGWYSNFDQVFPPGPLGVHLKPFLRIAKNQLRSPPLSLRLCHPRLQK